MQNTNAENRVSATEHYELIFRVEFFFLFCILQMFDKMQYILDEEYSEPNEKMMSQPFMPQKFEQNII